MSRPLGNNAPYRSRRYFARSYQQPRCRSCWHAAELHVEWAKGPDEYVPGSFPCLQRDCPCMEYRRAAR